MRSINTSRASAHGSHGQLSSILHENKMQNHGGNTQHSQPPPFPPTRRRRRATADDLENKTFGKWLFIEQAFWFTPLYLTIFTYKLNATTNLFSTPLSFFNEKLNNIYNKALEKTDPVTQEKSLQLWMLKLSTPRLLTNKSKMLPRCNSACITRL